MLSNKESGSWGWLIGSDVKRKEGPVDEDAIEAEFREMEREITDELINKNNGKDAENRRG